jgi:hypothetical protein
MNEGRCKKKERSFYAPQALGAQVNLCEGKRYGCVRREESSSGDSRYGRTPQECPPFAKTKPQRVGHPRKKTKSELFGRGGHPPANQ